MAGLVTLTSCQTHDRAAYHYDREPVRTGTVKLETTRTVSGVDSTPIDDPNSPPPQPGQSGLEGPALIP